MGGWEESEHGVAGCLGWGEARILIYPRRGEGDPKPCAHPSSFVHSFIHSFTHSFIISWAPIYYVSFQSVVKCFIKNLSMIILLSEALESLIQVCWVS